MKYGFQFSIVATALVAIAVIHGGWHYLLVWPAVSFGLVATAYLRFGPSVFGKSERGTLSVLNQLFLLPYLVCAWTLWYAIRRVSHEPAVTKLTDNLFVGRRLLSHERPANLDHVVDLTCEFNEPFLLRNESYHSLPVLDGHAPSPDQLRHWVERVAGLSGKIYIHCAERHGRSGMFAAALLLKIGHSRTPSEALEFIQSKRPLVRLSKHQIAVLYAVDESDHPPMECIGRSG